MPQSEFHYYENGIYRGAILADSAAQVESLLPGVTVGPPPAVQPTEHDVRVEGARRLEAIAAAYTPQERETWAQQVKDAEAFQADNTAAVPFLDGIAQGRGITTAALVQIILGNASAYSIAAGAVLGAQGALIAMDPIPADYTADVHWP